MPSITEKAVAVGIYLLVTLTILAFAAESPLRAFLAEWKTSSVGTWTLLSLGKVLGLLAMTVLFAILLALSQ